MSFLLAEFVRAAEIRVDIDLLEVISEISSTCSESGSSSLSRTKALLVFFFELEVSLMGLDAEEHARDLTDLAGVVRLATIAAEPARDLTDLTSVLVIASWSRNSCGCRKEVDET